MVYNTTVHFSSRDYPPRLVYTESPLPDPALDMVVGSQPRTAAAAACHTLVATTRECVKKAQKQEQNALS